MRPRQAVITMLLVLTMAAPGAAQSINFTSELPRTLVLIDEADGMGMATRGVQAFLRAAGFPLVELSLAPGEAQRQAMRAALDGDNAAALELGRDYGAHVLVLGRARWQAARAATAAQQGSGAELELRALRLDAGNVLVTHSARGSGSDVTERGARAQAVRQAIAQLMQQSGFVGALVNDWSEQPWSSQDYFRPDPGTADSPVAQPATRRMPLLALTRADVVPLPGAGRANAMRRHAEALSQYDVRVEGIVAGRVKNVVVEGRNAQMRPLASTEARRLGLDLGTQRFSATLQLAPYQNAVTVRANAPNGETTTASAAAHIGERWAVVVGVGDYRSNNIRDLRFAARDAQAFYDFLRSPAAGPFADDHIMLLKDEQATGQSMREALFVFLQRADHDDLVVIYYAGHGLPDPSWPDNLYLLPHDTDINALAASGFPMWDLKTALRRHIKAERVIVIADACRASMLHNTTAASISRSFEDLFTPSRRMLLVAADDHEQSQADTRWGGGHGVFTYNLLNGLEGAADADKDGLVTFTEVSDYVSGKVRLETNGRQTPRRSGLGDVPLAEVQPMNKAAGGTR